MQRWRMSWQEGVWKYTGLCQAIVLDALGWTWIHPRIHGLHWIDLFWASVIYGWTMFCGFRCFLEACILHEVFAECQQRLRMFLCKTTFAENWSLESCGIWCGDDELGFCHMHGFNLVFYFNNFVDENFVEMGFTFCCMWATGNCVFEWCMMFFKQRLHGRLFHLRLGWFCFWNLMLQHGARQQIRDKARQHGTAADR